MSQDLLNDCFRYDGRRLSHRDALDQLRQRLAPAIGVEIVPLSHALGRVLAERVAATIDVPPHTNSAVDGYAYNAAHCALQNQFSLPVIGRSAAGAPFLGEVYDGSAVRIFTGAVVPVGFDTVAMQEDCAVHTSAGKDSVTLPERLKPGSNVRMAGEDLKRGNEVFPIGHIVRPQDLAALSSIGCGSVSCFKRLRCAVVSTGDEILRPGERERREGDVFDANAPMLLSLLDIAGVEVIDAGLWPDDRLEVVRRLGALAERCDLILTSGGASQGDEDYMALALSELGSRHFWQLGIKPGRPLMFGQIGRTLVAGLPGNPVAVFVCFLLYVWPMIRRLGGAPWREPKTLSARAKFSFANRKRGRREFWRGVMEDAGDGLQVDKFDRDGSGLITGLRMADCLIDIPEDTGDISVGDRVQVIPFSNYGILDR